MAADLPERPVRTGSKTDSAERRTMSYQRTCKVCQSPFEHRYPHAVYCCNGCKKKADAAYAMLRYNADIAVARKLQVEHKRLRFAARWRLILDRFGNKCARCEQTFPPVVYDLHHVHGKKSRADTPAKIISNGSEKRFLSMLNEVTLMCANCHRLHHAETGNWAPARQSHGIPTNN